MRNPLRHDIFKALALALQTVLIRPVLWAAQGGAAGAGAVLRLLQPNSSTAWPWPAGPRSATIGPSAVRLSLVDDEGQPADPLDHWSVST